MLKDKTGGILVESLQVKKVLLEEALAKKSMFGILTVSGLVDDVIEVKRFPAFRKYHFDAFFINKKFKAKDISDAVKNNSYNDVKQWLDKELQRYDNL